jgi:transposase
VAKTYRPYDPSQSYLLPPSPRDWLPESHLSYFVLDLVKSLNLRQITSTYERELRGFPPHDPRMMVALLIYGYCVGIRSSRQIEKKTHEDVAFRVLAGGHHPDHTCISEFRRKHLDAFVALFGEVVKLCQQGGLVKLGHVAIDGTKMKANASKHKAMSYDRMMSEEKRLKAVIAQIVAEAESVDAAEDAEFGKGKRGDEITDELLRNPKTRMARIKQLRAELEAEAAQQRAAAANRDHDDDPPPTGAGELPSHQIPTDKQGKPTPKAQRNFTDADSRIMKAGGDFVQAYNCQAAVDGEHQIIVAQLVTNQPPDVEHMPAVMEQTAINCGAMPEVATLDAGYFSAENVAYGYSQGVDVYIPTERWKHNEAPPLVRGRAPKDMTLKQEMTRKLRTKRGREIYARRKAIVEPVFGQIKAARGIREFLLRGIDKVRGEWSLITLTHNVLKLYRSGGLQPA